MSRPLIIGRQAGIETARCAITGQHVMVGRAVAGVFVPERTDQRDLVHLLGHTGQQVADLHARHVGLGRLDSDPNRIGKQGHSLAFGLAVDRVVIPPCARTEQRD